MPSALPYLLDRLTAAEQMKMFLTRIGFGSKVAITGDLTQKDIPAGQPSGLDVAGRVLFIRAFFAVKDSRDNALNHCPVVNAKRRFRFIFDIDCH